MNILNRVHCDWRRYIEARRSKLEEKEDADALHRRATAKKLLAVLRAGVQRHKCEVKSLDERLVSYTEVRSPWILALTIASGLPSCFRIINKYVLFLKYR